MSLVVIDDLYAAEPMADSIRGFAIDVPTAETEVDSDAFEVMGWVLGRERPVVGIKVLFGDDLGIVHHWPVAVVRRDVAAVYPDAPEAGRSGFRGWVSTSGLPPAVRLAFRGVFDDGTEVKLPMIRGRRRFLSAASPPLVRAPGNDDQPRVEGTSEERPGTWPRLCCDTPADGAEFYPGVIVAGWAFSPVGIKDVSLWLGDVELGLAVLGNERLDLARAQPEWPAAPRAGFSFRMIERPPTVPPGRSELTIVAED